MALLEMHRSPPASSTDIRDPLASSRAGARQREGWLLASSTLIIATSSPARAQEHGLADGLLKTPGQGYGKSTPGLWLAIICPNCNHFVIVVAGAADKISLSHSRHGFTQRRLKGTADGIPFCWQSRRVDVCLDPLPIPSLVPIDDSAGPHSGSVRMQSF
jgi:hypothetical protein